MTMTLRAALASALVALAIGGGASPTVADDRLPESPCQNAWQEPRSDLADRCRDKGWTVWKRLVVTPRKVVVYYTIPGCRLEYPDYEPVPPFGPRPCYVNFGTDGSNGRIFYVTQDAKRHYVKKAR